MHDNEDPDAASEYQRAIKLDPHFALAYASLGFFTGQVEDIRTAYEMRSRVSQREKLYIEAHYFDSVTGDLEKSRQIFELWVQIYPRDVVPRGNLARFICPSLGQYNRSLQEARLALPLSPNDPAVYENLVFSYLKLNRLEEVRITAEEAKAKNFDSLTKPYLYSLAFLQNDIAGMEQQLRWGEGEPRVADVLLSYESNTAAFSGRLVKAREYSRRAVAAAERVGNKTHAASYETQAALREALFKNATDARQDIVAALRLSRAGYDSTDRYEQGSAALALALAGNPARALVLADDLGKRFPEDTLIQFHYLPAVQAQIALSRNNPAKAIEILQAAAPFELGAPYELGIDPETALYPVFVRGQAHLAAHQGSEAAIEFQKILDHRGIVLNEPIGALAHLDLGRAYALQGETAKARAAYQDFLTLWKNADPDIRILKQAKAEYARLQ